MAALHVAQLNFPPAPAGLGIEALLERWPSLADIAEMVAGAGIRVSVLQAAFHSARLTRNGVDYRFVDIGKARSAGEKARRFASMLAGMDVGLLHAHGLGFVEEAAAIADRMSLAAPIVLQDHADRPPRWWRRARHRRCFAMASGIAFTSLEQVRPFAAANLFAPSTRFFAIPESSSRFTVGDCDRARAESGLDGDPCVVWVGRLTRGKDPMTVLEGVALAAPRLPDLHLWCAFGAAPMLAEVRARIADDPRLAGRVHLLGEVPHARIETLLRAADFFVSGSRAEGSGYATMEALACGVTPVLTDIPAFRALTGNGRIGHLWPCGDATRLADELFLAATARASPQQVRAHFDATLSFEAVGRLWSDAYAQVLDGWRRRAA
ncbi:MAG: Glycosyltransferase [Rhodanobacteraceae bacterium]|jgi:glycosyltransferase involved in cell wall biosynthesis|nr:MAG: Glycosyltransferase [Rhodanobacteraceae bacterium]